MKRSRLNLPEVNAGSMADIAFLLLIFFLVATTINEDKGIPILLPKFYEGPPGLVADRNVLSIQINRNNKLLVENDLLEIGHIRAYVKDFIKNEDNRSDRPHQSSDAIIAIKNDVHTTYEVYVNVYGEIYNAYKELRNDFARTRFGKSYITLSPENQKVIRQHYPLKISEIETDYTTTIK